MKYCAGVRMQYIAYIFGIAAMASLFMLYQQKTRARLLVCKLIADCCWALYYLYLGAYGGMIPNLVGILRESVFFFRGRKKWAGSPIIPAMFICMNWALGILTFKQPINILPIAASTFVTISLWCQSPRLTKAVSFPVAIVFLTYNCLAAAWLAAVNESFSLASIIISFIKDKALKKKGEKHMSIFTPDIVTDKTPVIIEGAPIHNAVGIIPQNAEQSAIELGARFADEIERNFVADFEKNSDLMAHVTTFTVIDGTVYMSYYANTLGSAENPNEQTARLAYCPVDNPREMTTLDMLAAGDKLDDKTVNQVYDTVLMRKDDKEIYILFTARVEENYYRFFRVFNVESKTLGDVRVNRFKAGGTTNDFSASGIAAALAKNGIGCKKTYADIGIMQKLSSRTEDGKTFYYTGAYSGDFTCIIKSADLVTWEYVAQPDFPNLSKWENATYVKDDKCFYFVRQQDDCPYGFLTSYDLTEKTWAQPLLVEDCQSRGDFIENDGKLYLFHAPIDREHIGMIKVDCSDLKNSKTVFNAHMHSSCFYPFVQLYADGKYAMSYTVNRKHVRLASFSFEKLTEKQL